jgi:hypothetical protein
MTFVDTFSSSHNSVAVRMFDADCKNMNRVPQSTAFHFRTGVPPPLKIQVDAVPSVNGPASTAITQPNILFHWGVYIMPLLYVTVTISGLTVVGILGAAMGMTRTLLSVALFNGTLVPVLFLHCLMYIENKYAVGLGVCTVVYLNVSVPLGLVYNTHLFTSISFGLVIGFHCVAGGVGWRCMVHILIIIIFVGISIWESPRYPDRGDTTGLILLPCIRIMFVGVSGAISTMSPLGIPRSVVIM